jgi:magnesium transporter
LLLIRQQKKISKIILLVLRLLLSSSVWYLKVFKAGKSKIKLAEDNLEIDKSEELQALCK